MPKRDEITDDIILEDPGTVRDYSAIARILAKVEREHPGQWAKVRHYQWPNSAYAIRRTIRQTRHGWDAEVRRTEDGGAWLYVKYVGIRDAQGNEWRG